MSTAIIDEKEKKFETGVNRETGKPRLSIILHRHTYAVCLAQDVGRRITVHQFGFIFKMALCLIRTLSNICNIGCV